MLATKVFGRMHDGPGGGGLSRKAILEQVDASLRRLGTDYIDLYQIHRFDPEAPVEETMEVLHDIVKAGKVRYLGASSMYAWQFAKLQHAAGPASLDPVRLHAEPVQPAPPPGRTRADGHVRGPGRGSGSLLPQRERPTRPPMGRAVHALQHRPRGAGVRLPSGRARRRTRCKQVAETREVSMAQVALAWVLRNPLVSAPIVGATKPHHLTEAVAALDLQLSDEEARQMEEHYTPHGPSWF